MKYIFMITSLFSLFILSHISGNSYICNDNWSHESDQFSITNVVPIIKTFKMGNNHILCGKGDSKEKPIVKGGNRKMTSFNPSKHGFKFSNTFKNHGFVAGIHLNFSGLCGGMSYAALDYFNVNKSAPKISKIPNEGTQLAKFIRGRQWKTYDNQAYKWVELGFNPFGWRTSEFWKWGVQGFNGGRLQELTNQIDKGKPVVLGLFAPGSAGLTSSHHQVLAIGYDLGNYKGDLKGETDNVKIFIYDPNKPNRTMTLRPDSKNLRYYYEEDRSCTWLTYFVDLKYSPVKPLDPNAILRCSSTNFVNLDLSGQTLNQKNFRCADARKAKFRGATVSGTDFYNSDLTKTYFYGANCRNTNFEKSKLNLSNFEGADLKNCNFSSTDVSSSRFYGADLKYAIFNKANAQRSNFQGADLHKGKFQYTSFREAYLYKTSLNSADCSFADFRGANLDGTDLRGANLYKANFKGAKITRNTLFNPSEIKNVINWPGVR